MWHRHDWSILHSYVHLNDDELEALKMCPGITDNGYQSALHSRMTKLTFMVIEKIVHYLLNLYNHPCHYGQIITYSNIINNISKGSLP